MKSLFCLVTLLFSTLIMASVSINVAVPKKLKKEILLLLKEKSFISRFHLNMYNSNTLVIESEDGMIRSLPLKGVTASYLFNIMETMEEDLFILRETKKVKKITASLNPQKKRTPSITKNNNAPSLIEFLPSINPSGRFYTGISLSNEEDGAGGIEGSVLFGFFQLGTGVRKGKDVDFNYRTISWNAKGLFVSLNLLRIHDFYFSIGEELFHYTANSKTYLRDASVFQ